MSEASLDEALSLGSEPSASSVHFPLVAATVKGGGREYRASVPHGQVHSQYYFVDLDCAFWGTPRDALLPSFAVKNWLTSAKNGWLRSKIAPFLTAANHFLPKSTTFKHF